MQAAQSRASPRLGFMKRVGTWVHVIYAGGITSIAGCKSHGKILSLFWQCSLSFSMPKIRTQRTKPPPEGFEDIRLVN